jgi:hypothetical protein
MYRGYDRIKALKQELKRSGSRRNIPDLLALHQNNDPFYCGSPADWALARWFKHLWTTLEVREGVHLRRIHYRMVSMEPPPKKPDGMGYENTERDWEFLQNAGACARYLGEVDAHAFVDRRNPPPHVYMAPRFFPAVPGAELEELVEWTLPAIESDLSALLDLSIPRVASVSGYEYEAVDQPYLVEVWVEKSTMDEVLQPVCQVLGVNLVTSLGFQSITGAIWHLQRVRRLGKPSRILYISDFDPAGDSMPVSVARQLEFWLEKYAPKADIKLTPLALTRAQVEQYALPRIPIKGTDKRGADFEERRGEGAVELDAMEELHPGVLADLVRKAVTPYRDEGLESRLDDAAQEAQEAAEAAWEEDTADLQQGLDALKADIGPMLARYQGRLAALNAELQAELAPFQERIESLRHAAENLVFTFDPELPARPEPETDGVDEADWLFDSQREYLTQIDHYKAHKQGEAA